MEIIVFVIILRLLAPLLILRFPIAGVILASVLDWHDHSFIGGYEYYQILDKWLDFYFLAICAWTVRSWTDEIAKKLAFGLFWFRAVGVIVLSVTNLEWTLLVFPDIFGFFFIFYIVYRQFSGSSQLFTGWKSTAPVMIAVVVPKMMQEYGLHIVYPYYNLTPGWVAAIMEWPLVGRTALVAAVPLAALAFYIIRARQLKSSGQTQSVDLLQS